LALEVEKEAQRMEERGENESRMEGRKGVSSSHSLSFLPYDLPSSLRGSNKKLMLTWIMWFKLLTRKRKRKGKCQPWRPVGGDRGR